MCAMMILREWIIVVMYTGADDGYDHDFYQHNDDDEEEERKFGDYCCHVHRGCQAQSLAAQTKRRRRRIRGDTLNSPL